VADVSHELKTPLTSIQGFARALLDGTAAAPDDRRRAAEIIQAEAARMHAMVMDLLELARLDAGTAELKMATLDVRLLLHGILERFAPQAARSGIALRLELPPVLPDLAGDADRLAQVFGNLMDNALKFSPPGGVVTLRAAAVRGRLDFEVQDTGTGIPESALGRIFDRFYQADRARAGGARHGSGLGLAIAREIVHAHGGRISVRSQPGLGTTFIVSLPLAPPADTLRTHRKK
jgi:signal transduction histidine kinase